MSFIPNPDFIFTPFRELKTTNRYNVISEEHLHGTSSLRYNVEKTGSGDLTNVQSELVLTCSANSDSVMIETRKRLVYTAGFASEFGIGIRTSSSLSGNQTALWGLFDEENGFGYGKDVNGMFAFIRKASQDTKVYQTDWNVRSSSLPDSSVGVIYQGNFTWYGYGTLELGMILSSSNNSIKKYVPVHRFNENERTSLNNPNLPVRAELHNSGTGAEADLYIGGFSAIRHTQFHTSLRRSSDFVSGTSVPSSDFVPLISLRKKTEINGFKTAAELTLNKLDLITNNNLVYRIYLNGTLTSASFTTPSEGTEIETISEIDKSATAISGGFVLFTGFVGTAGVSVGKPNASLASQESETLTSLFDDDVVTIAAKAISTTADVAAAINWTEGW